MAADELWQTAYEEIKYLRAMERIEQLKADNAWSFRQMKRFKGPAMGKVHWDYMLDEMVSTLDPPCIMVTD